MARKVVIGARRLRGVEPLEARLLLTSLTGFSIVAQTGGGYDSLGVGPSINDNGVVAFVGRKLNGSGQVVENLYAWDGSSTTQLMNSVFEEPTTGDAPTQTFDPNVEVNDQNEVLARRYLTALVQIGTPFGQYADEPLTYLETWPTSGQQAGTGKFGLPDRLVVMGDGGVGQAAPLLFFLNPATGGVYPSPFNQAGNFSVVYQWATQNNSGQVALSALNSGGRFRVTGPHASGTPFIGGGIGDLDFRPVMADNSDFVFSTGAPGQSGGALYREDYNFDVFEQIASPANGFTRVGSQPSISDDGSVITFTGDLSAAGAAAIDASQPAMPPINPGAGIFARVKMSTGFAFERIAGVAGSGFVDPGETFVDLNHDGVVQPGEDQGGFSSIDYDSPVCFASTNVQADRANVVFRATDAAGRVGAFSAHVAVDQVHRTVTAGPARPQLIFGDEIPGLAGQVTDVALHDATNAAGQVALWVKTTNGQAIVSFVPDLNRQLRPPLETLARALVYGNAWHVGDIVTQAGESLGYKVDAVFRDDVSGFYALGLSSDQYGPAIVFRGTDGPDPLDLFSDSDPNGVGYNQFQRNADLVEKWLNTTYAASGAIDFTGQSLGGTLTEWFASNFTHLSNPTAGSKLIDQLVTYNATGISFAAAAAFDPTEVGSVTHYVVNGDIVSMAGDAFIPGRVEMAHWSGWSLWDRFPGLTGGLKIDTHRLPLTVPSVTFPADVGGNTRVRPSDLTFQSFPDVSALNAPSYVHSAPEYQQSIAALQIWADRIGILYPAIKQVPGWLLRRDTAEAHRKEIGQALRDAYDQLTTTHPAAGGLIVTLFHSGQPLYDGVEYVLGQGVTVSFSTTDAGTLDLSGAIGMDRPLDLSLTLPDWLGGADAAKFLFSLASVGATGTITSAGLSLSGHVNLLGDVIGVDGTLTENWRTGAFMASGNTSLLGGFITTHDTIRIDPNGGLEAASAAVVTLPAGLPLIGGAVLTDGAFRLSFTSADLSKDYVAGWGSLFGVVVGVKVFFDGEWEFLSSASLPTSPAGASLAAAVPGSAGQSFTVPAGANWAVLEAQWQNASTAAAIRLIAPDGTVYSEAAIAADPNLDLVADLDTANRRAVKLTHPIPGVWRIELVDATGLGTTSFGALGNTPAAPAVSNVSATGGVNRQPVSISASVANATASTRVALYYDSDNAGSDGLLIASDLPVVNGVVNYAWTPATAPVGACYVYAVVSDANQIPAAAYAATPVTISEYRPATLAATFDYAHGNAITVPFTQDVSASLSAADFQLVDLRTGAIVATPQLPVAFDPFDDQATLTGLSGLPDGNYRLRLASAGVSNVAGSTLSADLTLDFFVLAGDVNHDRSVDFNDLVALAQNYNTSGGRTWAEGDFTGDGNVDFSDLVVVAQHYNSTLAPAAAPLPAPAPAPAAQAAPVPRTAALVVATSVPPPTPVKPIATVKPDRMPAPKPKPVAALLPKPIVRPVPAPKSAATTVRSPAPTSSFIGVAPSAASDTFGNTRIKRPASPNALWQ